jgi:hypothetical protein
MRESPWTKYLRELFHSARVAAAKASRVRRRRAAFTPRFEEFEPRLTPAAPTVISINRVAPAALTNANSVDFAVSFDQPVSGVDASDFAVNTTGSFASIAVTGSGATYTVTVNGVGDGRVRLNLLDDDTIVSQADALSLNGPGSGAQFTNAATYAATNRSQHIVFADVNGDLKPDIVVSDKDSASRVSVLLGNGNGTFQAAIISPANFPMRIFPADFNGDGKLDLLTVTPEGRDQLSLLLGNGDGTFRPSVLVSTGISPVAVADVNADGFQDVVFGESTSVRNLRLMLGNGNGTFRPSVAAATGTSSDATTNFAIARDVNADNKVDLVYSTNTAAFKIALGNGDGTFGNPTGFAGTVAANQGAVADINRDGILDVVTVTGTQNFANGTINSFLGNGDGTFQAGSIITTAPYPDSVDVADLNGDTFPDLVTHLKLVNNVAMSVHLGNGNGTFRPFAVFPSLTISSSSLAVGDINGDGQPDVAVAEYTLGASVRINRSMFSGETYEIDRTAPTTALTSTPPPLSTSSSAAFSFTANDPSINGVSSGLNRLEYRLDGGAYAPATSPVTFTGLSDGNHVFDLRAIDQAGNVGTSSYAWIVAVHTPYTSIDSKPPAVTNSSSATFTFTTSVPIEGLDHQEYRLDGGTFSAVVSPLTLNNLSEGPHTFEVRGVSGSAVVGPSASYSWNIDRTAPVVQILTQPQSSTGLRSATFTFSATDPVSSGISSGVSKVEYRIDNGDFIPAVNSASRNNLSVGTHTFDLRAIDAAGNATVVSYSWNVIDIAPPKVASINRAATVAPITNASSLAYEVTFSQPVTGVDAADFQVVKTGTIATSSLQVTGSGSAYTVTIGGIAGNGTVGLNLVDDNTIRGVSGLPLANNPNDPAIFQQGAPIASSMPSFTIPVADFNGDGNIDFVIDDRSKSSNNIAIYLGNGDGSFQAPMSFTGIDRPGCLIAADVNGDGKADLVMSSYTILPNGTGGVMLGNGNGTFQAPRTFALDGPNVGLDVADVNGDGKPDVVASANKFRISILLGNGDGTFKPRVTYAGASSGPVKFADINSDNKLDVVTGNQNLRSIGSYLGNGDGTFQAAVTVGAATFLKEIAVADLNGDGRNRRR